MRALGIEGLSVTMPHKAAVAAGVDRLSPTAARLQAVNTVMRRGNDLVGESTDGEGFLAALRKDEGWDPADRRCLILGAGGAARAVALALAGAGAAQVVVVGRRPDQAEAAAALGGQVGRASPPTVGALADEVAGADLVVNATPVGMTGVIRLDRSPLDRSPAAGPLPFDLDPAGIRSGQLIVDLIYSPAATPLVQVARQRGARATNGLGLLIHQAALQFRLWTGEDPPLEVMSAAAVAALRRFG
jgi:shikimate dehydrogenase